MARTHTRDTVVVAASAGGLECLRDLLSQLPAAFPAAVLVVLHVPAAGGHALPRILARAGRLPALTAVAGEAALAGRVYVAPPDHHMLLIDGTIQLSHGPRHNGVRPAADPLFISAAVARGPRVIAVVLSGALDDGAAGCAAVQRRGGLVVIQDPDEAAYESMPRAAIAASVNPRVLGVGDMGALIDRETRVPLPDTPLAPDLFLDRQLSMFLDSGAAPSAEPAAWSGVTCPECGGPLRQHDAVTPVRFDCPAGHAWSPESLVAAQASGIERALWAATVRLEERARLNRVLADSAARGKDAASADGFLSSARAAESAARAIRRLLGSAAAPAAADEGPDDS